MKHFVRLGLPSLLAACIAALLATPATAQQSTLTDEQLKARCRQLIAYYDRYGVGRSVHSDGRRNFDRIDASLACSEGKYAEGVAIMEQLLRRKKFTSPALGLPDEPEDDD